MPVLWPGMTSGPVHTGSWPNVCATCIAPPQCVRYMYCSTPMCMLHVSLHPNVYATCIAPSQYVWYTYIAQTQYLWYTYRSNPICMVHVLLNISLQPNMYGTHIASTQYVYYKYRSNPTHMVHIPLQPNMYGTRITPTQYDSAYRSWTNMALKSNIIPDQSNSNMISCTSSRFSICVFVCILICINGNVQQLPLTVQVLDFTGKRATRRKSSLKPT